MDHVSVEEMSENHSTFPLLKFKVGRVAKNLKTFSFPTEDLSPER